MYSFETNVIAVSNGGHFQIKYGRHANDRTKCYQWIFVLEHIYFHINISED